MEYIYIYIYGLFFGNLGSIWVPHQVAIQLDAKNLAELVELLFWTMILRWCSHCWIHHCGNLLIFWFGFADMMWKSPRNLPKHRSPPSLLEKMVWKGNAALVLPYILWKKVIILTKINDFTSGPYLQRLTSAQSLHGKFCPHRLCTGPSWRS